ncbi:MAG: sulfur carrier protein ThiS [Solirubrobacterales bacterium]
MHINGMEIKNADNIYLYDYLIQNGYTISYVAVECNGSIVPKSQFKEKVLADSDVVEIVSFVGGG